MYILTIAEIGTPGTRRRTIEKIAAHAVHQGVLFDALERPHQAGNHRPFAPGLPGQDRGARRPVQVELPGPQRTVVGTAGKSLVTRFSALRITAYNPRLIRGALQN